MGPQRQIKVDRMLIAQQDLLYKNNTKFKEVSFLSFKFHKVP